MYSKFIARKSSSLLGGHRRFASSFQKHEFLSRLGLNETSKGVYNGQWGGTGELRTQLDPATNEAIGYIQMGTAADYEQTVKAMEAAKAQWMEAPAPVRGEVVRKIGQKLRDHVTDLGGLVSLEMGKIRAEGIGEVQEAIDICDFAVGLSRSLNGAVIPSERPNHFMMERYNPLKGHVGIITAFNFPVAVYFWNLALSLVCGNTQMWKPSESVAMTAVACTKIVTEVIQDAGYSGAIASLVCGTGQTVGEALIRDPRMELVSFTGSTKTGRHISEVVAGRFGKRILELGGNNAAVVDKSANLDIVLRAVLFGAVGTAGQRCTTLRRLLVHEDVFPQVVQGLLPAYKSVKIGNPMDKTVLCGPLHNKAAVDVFKATVQEAKAQGGKLLIGGDVVSGPGNFVQPTIFEMPKDAPLLQEERFVPILYITKISSVDEGIALNNGVKQGLSSALFTQDPGQIFKWTGPAGSDTGIVNVNIGTSGAEIGGAFGGDKETGGGRESGSDAWKQYMRRSTCTLNYGKELPLAQGIDFTSTSS